MTPASELLPGQPDSVAVCWLQLEGCEVNTRGDFLAGSSAAWTGTRQARPRGSHKGLNSPAFSPALTSYMCSTPNPPAVLPQHAPSLPATAPSSSLLWSFPRLGSGFFSASRELGFEFSLFLVPEPLYWRVQTPPQFRGVWEDRDRVSLPGTGAGFLFLVAPPSAWAASAHRGRPNSVAESRPPRDCGIWRRHE